MTARLEDAPLAAVLEAAPQDAAATLARLAREYARSHSPAETLRFLFDLDTRLYSLEGETAVAYGGGVHTKHRHIRYHDFFVERIAAGETVLDIGCGYGAVACDVATRSAAVVTAIDLNPQNIQQARERHAGAGVTYIHGDATRDLPAGHYDVVILSNVLEHIEHRVEFLKRVSQAATPDRWLLRVPLFEREWRVPLKKELGLDWRLDPTHFTEYTQESFEQEIAEAGLEITHKEIRWGEIWSELRNTSL